MNNKHLQLDVHCTFYIMVLMKVKQESEKVGLKLNIQKMKIMASDLAGYSPWGCKESGMTGQLSVTHYQIFKKQIAQMLCTSF